MPNWKKLIVSGSDASLNNLTVNNAVTASFFKGDGSALTNVQTEIAETATVVDTFTSQTTVSTTHNFGTKNVLVFVYDSNDEQLIPATVSTPNDNGVQVTFDVPTSGRVVIAKGGHLVQGVGTASDSHTLNGESGSYYLDYTNFTNTPTNHATTGSNNFVGTQYITGSLIPGANETYDLGTANARWRDLYLSGSTIVLGDTKITTDTDGNIELKDRTTNTRKILKVDEIEIGTGNNARKLKVDNGNFKFTDTNDTIQSQKVGHLLPSANKQYDLGSPTEQFRHIYMSSASLYVDGVKVLSSDSNTLTFTTDAGQSIKLLETGGDDITLQTDTGNIELKGTVEIESGKKIIDSAGTEIQFGDSLGITGSISLTGTVDGIDLRTFSSSLDSRISSNDDDITGLNTYSSSLKNALTLDGQNVTIVGNLTVSGTTTTVDSTTLDIGDNIISLNGAGAALGGIHVNDGPLSGSLLWDGTANQWIAGPSGSEVKIALATEVSGSFTALSSSLSGRISQNEEDIISINAATSSYALKTDISGSFTSLSSSLAGRVEILEGETDSLIAATSSYALASKISGSFTNLSSSLSGRISQNESELRELTAVTSSYALKADISGSFASTSSSLALRISAQESFSSSLDATFATDAQVSQAVSALNAATSSYALASKISGSFTSLSSSLQGRIAAQEQFSSSLGTTEAIYSGSFSGSFVGDGSQLSGVTSYTDADTLTYINSINVVSGSATQVKSFLAITEADISDLTHTDISALNAATSSYALASKISGSFTDLSSSLALDIATNTAKTGYTDNLVKSKLNNDNVISGSATQVKSFLSLSSSDISDVDAFSQSGTYADLRAQGTTASDVGLGNVTNESKATMFTDAALTGNPTAPTQAGSDDSTKIATTAFVQSRLDDLIGNAGAGLDTLAELSASLADATGSIEALTTSVSSKLTKASNLSDLTDAAQARTNLGVEIGADVQAYDADLTTLGGLTKTDGNFIVADGTTWTVENGSTARASLGLGNVENTALSTWTGNGGALDNQYITNGAGYITEHPSISAASSVDNSGNTVIQDITLDSNGHITGLASLNLNDSYYTEAEIDNKLTNGTVNYIATDAQVGTNIHFFKNDGGGNLGIRFNAGPNPEYSIEDGSAWEFQFNNDSQNGDFVIYYDGSISAANEAISWTESFRLDGGTSDAYVWGNRVLTVADEGSGNGLDADTLDGNHASAFLTGESDTLATVTGRGASTTTGIQLNSGATIDFNKTNASSGGDTSFLNIGYNGSWSNNADGMAAIEVNDGTGTVGKFGVSYNTTDEGYFAVKNLYNGGSYGASGTVFKVDSDGDGYFSRNLVIAGDLSGVTDLYVADQIIHTGDTNTYTQFHAADQWRVVTGGTERLEVNNSQTTVNSPLHVNGNILLTGTATTTNQARTIDFTGFDKEGTTDFSDRAYIQHTTNTGGHGGSVLVISSQNDSNDGIAFLTNASSDLKHNGNAIWTAGNDGAGSGLDADLWDGNQFSSYLNQAVLTTSSPTFNNVTLSGDLTVNGNQIILDNVQSRTKLMVWSGTTYGIGMESGYTYGHIGNDYVMSFQMSDTNNRGFWWGDASHSNAQGAMSLTTQGKATIATSLSIGEGETVTSPSTTPLYVYGSGSTVFEVEGSQGQLFSIDDDLTGEIFAVSDISGIPILSVDSSGVVTVDDTLYVTGDITAYYSSDERLKKNIKPIESPLEKLKLISGNTFEWDEENTAHKNTGKDVGVIAQEIEKVLPELVTERRGGYKAVQYEKIVALLIESNKALLERVEELEKKLK